LKKLAQSMKIQLRTCLESLVFAAVLLLSSPAVFAQTAMQTQLANSLAGQHPRLLMERAKVLFDQGDSADAAFLFYLGQLRWSVDKLARPGEPEADPAKSLEALNDRIGRPINGVMLADMAVMAAALKSVRAYESSHADQFTPLAQFPQIWETQLASFDEFVRYVDDEARTQEQRKRARALPDGAAKP
jgi:hypothetical protein